MFYGFVFVGWEDERRRQIVVKWRQCRGAAAGFKPASLCTSVGGH